MKINTVELNLLSTCQQSIEVKKNLIRRLAKTLSLEPQHLFYQWLLGKIPQHGYLLDRKWKYFFHGFECDLRQTATGQFIRIEFGPGGRTDTFTDWGIYKYLSSSYPNWLTTPEVEHYFSQSNSRLDAYQKISFLVNKLHALKLIGPVAPELNEIYTHYQLPNATHLESHVKLPKTFPEKKYFDTRVCNRLIITPEGWQILTKHPSDTVLTD